MNKILTIDTDNYSTSRIVKGKILNLVEEQNQILKQIMPKFDFSDESLDAKQISDDLIETLKAHKAFGIAANQCGLMHRVFVVGAEDAYITMFNPEILNISDEVVHMPEYCLSFPFLELYISRPESIVIRYQDVDGNVKTDKFSGLTARCCIHELEHLDGKTFHQNAKPLALKTGLKKREKQIKNFARELVQSGHYNN